MKPKRTPPLATITEWLGHRFLKVGGITMCREGDVCRDCNTPGTRGTSVWDLRAMRSVQNRINRVARASSL